MIQPYPKSESYTLSQIWNSRSCCWQYPAPVEGGVSSPIIHSSGVGSQDGAGVAWNRREQTSRFVCLHETRGMGHGFIGMFCYVSMHDRFMISQPNQQITLNQSSCSFLCWCTTLLKRGKQKLVSGLRSPNFETPICSVWLGFYLKIESWVELLYQSLHWNDGTFVFLFNMEVQSFTTSLQFTYCILNILTYCVWAWNISLKLVYLWWPVYMG